MSLLSELRASTKGLLFLSESDAPLKAFYWRGVTVDSEAALRDVLRLDPTIPITTQGLEEFFAPMTVSQDWDDDEAKADQARFVALVAQLQLLKEVCVYRIGSGPEVRAFVIGTSPDGSAAGVRTLLTET